jgi:hypothetical protein
MIEIKDAHPAEAKMWYSHYSFQCQHHYTYFQHRKCQTIWLCPYPCYLVSKLCVTKKQFIASEEGISPLFQWGTWWTRECVTNLVWDIIRWEHAFQEGVEKNKHSLGLVSGDRMAGSPHRRKREASLVLLDIASNLQPACSIRFNFQILKWHLDLN